MAAASFRHGPIELVDDCFRGIVFAPMGKTRALNLALASELERFGGKVLLVGPPDAAHSRFCYLLLLSSLYPIAIAVLQTSTPQTKLRHPDRTLPQSRGKWKDPRILPLLLLLLLFSLLLFL